MRDKSETSIFKKQIDTNRICPIPKIRIVFINLTYSSKNLKQNYHTRISKLFSMKNADDFHIKYIPITDNMAIIGF